VLQPMNADVFSGIAKIPSIAFSIWKFIVLNN
jgi:hypothetical protein